MQRRDLLKGGMTVVTSSLLPLWAFAGRKQPVTWAPYQNLDLDPQDMVRDEDIALIISSCMTNWTLASLVAKGALTAGN